MRLVARNGPLAGTAIALEDGAVVSAPGSEEGIQRLLRVRAHDSAGFVLQPLDRRTPVFLNGLPLTGRPLQPRDEVQVGDSLFVVHDSSEETTAATVRQPLLVGCGIRAERLRSARPVLELNFDETLIVTGVDETGRETRDLLCLMRVAAALSSIQGLASVDGALAGFVFDVLPAESVVLAGDPGPADVRSAWTSSAVADVSFDPDLLGRAARDRVAAVVEAGGRYFAVAPMMAFGRAAGTVWVAIRPGADVDAGHLRLLLVVTALAAVARERTIESARLQEENDLLQAEINLEHNMVGRSRPMRALFDRIARVARTESTILIRGESGTGKELVARAAHRNSARADRPFVAINCAAITESLLESELFGHEKGAFTGAIGQKKGKLELADGGTLFLDEIGELPLPLQAKLLRALQEREFERVGGTRPVRVDFRLIAATNRDLEGAVRAGTFRQDLFYRLNVVTLALPPLRDRKEDVALLAEYFVRKHAPRCGRRVRGIAPSALARLEKHQWPGNVRELENVIEQALALGACEDVGVDDLPPSIGDGLPGPGGSLDYHAVVEQAKRDLIVRAFERAGHSHAGAARLLGVHPNYLHRLLRNFNMRPEKVLRF
jgi:Nif-specific regulatory protein